MTFLFSDIEGSTRLWEASDAAMRLALTGHDEIMRVAIEGQGGYVFSTAGDSFAAAFGRVGDSLAADQVAQDVLAQQLPPGAPVRVQMGVHTGAIVRSPDVGHEFPCWGGSKAR